MSVWRVLGGQEVLVGLSTFTGVLARGMVTLLGGEEMLVALRKMLCRG